MLATDERAQQSNVIWERSDRERETLCLVRQPRIVVVQAKAGQDMQLAKPNQRKHEHLPLVYHAEITHQCLVLNSELESTERNIFRLG